MVVNRQTGKCVKIVAFLETCRSLGEMSVKVGRYCI